MKTVVLLVLATLTSAPAFALEWPEDMPRVRWQINPLFDQKGYRLGFVKEYVEARYFHQEGQLLMGYNSGKAHILDEECLNEAGAIADPAKRAAAEAKCEIDKNPWLFDTFDTELFKHFSGGPDQLSETKGVPVLAYYFRETFTPFGWLSFGWGVFFASTAKFVSKMWPIDPTLRMPKTFRVDIDSLVYSPKWTIPRRGFMKGRVVKATMDHKYLKTFEITVQEVTSPDIFRRLSVSDNDMYDHIVMAMRTGAYLNIGWVQLPEGEAQSRGVWGYDTHLRIESIELIDDASSIQTRPAGTPRRSL